MFKTLAGVSHDGGQPGIAFGGGIYSVSCDIGTSSEPTKITLNVVAEQPGSYVTPALSVESGNGKTIQIGSGVNTVAFNNMYVYKYNFNQSASSKTMSVTLIDQSVAFDKIFVGLVGRHDTDHATPLLETFPFTIECPECNTLWPRPHNVTGSKTKQIFAAGGGIAYISPDLLTGNGGIDGGYIILGREQWTDGNCEIPKVEYTFEELLTVLSQALGYDVTTLVPFNRSNFYQTSYTGSLRDVLNAWASDFSFSFTVDSTSPTLKILGTDLTTAISLTSVKAQLAGGFTSASAGAMIRSRSDTATLENTYVQQPLVKNIKAAKTFQRQQINYMKMTGKPVSIPDAIGPWGHLGRTDNQFNISIGLAKYKPEARMIWLSDQCAMAGVGASAWPSLGFIPAGPTATNPYGGRIGGPPGSTLDSAFAQQKHDLVKLFKGAGTNDPFQHPVWSNFRNYDVYIGVWNEAYQNAMEQFDAELADFYNKYAYWYSPCPFNETTMSFDCSGWSGGPGLTNPPPSFRECPDFPWQSSGLGSLPQQVKWYDYAAQLTTLPETKFYKKGAYPFQDILRANAGVFAYSASIPGGPGVGGAARNPDGDGIFELADNAWGTQVEHIEKLFANKWILDNSNTGGSFGSDPNLAPQSSIDHFMPVYARFDSDQILETELRNILPNFKLNFMGASQRAEGYFPGIALIPRLGDSSTTWGAKLQDPTTGLSKPILEIGWAGVSGAIGTTTNGVAYDNVRRRRLQQVGDDQKDCVIFCEEDLVQDICECPTIEDPLHKWPFIPPGTDPSYPAGYNGFMANVFLVYHLGNFVPIIFPVGHDYVGYWKSDVTFRGTYPKEMDVLGQPPGGTITGPVGNVMSTKVVDVDVTQELNPPAMGVKTQFVVRDALSTTPIDLQTYYGHIASMNQQSVFPGETINVKIDGLEFDGLISAGLLGPASGLTSFNISLDGEGMSTDLTYSSRVSKMPKRDIWMQQIGPRATQGRTGGGMTGSGGAQRPNGNASGAFPWGVSSPNY